MAVLSIEDLIRKKEEIKPQQVKRVFVERLGGELEIRRIPVTDYWNMTARVDSDDMAALLPAQIEMIYAAVPALHDPRLHEAYGVDVPTDIVPMVFGEDIGAMAMMAAEIAAMYGDVEQETKN